MLTKNKYCKKFSAFGLAEVMVGMAITGVILLSIVSLAISSYREVKNNELADMANNVMLITIEYFRTPTVEINSQIYQILSNIEVDQVKVFRLINSFDRNILDIRYEEVNSNINLLPLSECTENSPFKITFINNQLKFLLCNKIIVSRSIDGYNIISYVTYKDLRGKIRTAQLIGYRQNL